MNKPSNHQESILYDSHNIALIRLSAIGDCCLVLPVVRSILAQQPKAHIYWLISPPAYELLKYCTHPRLTFKVIDKPKSIKDYLGIRRYFADKHIQTVLAMQASSRANLIYPMIKAPIKIGFDKQRAREGQWLFCNKRIDFKKEHLHDSFARFAQQLGVNTDNPDFSIQLAPNADEQLQKLGLPNSYIVLNPAASKLERTPYVQFYHTLIERISQRFNTTVVLTGSKAEMEVDLAQQLCQAHTNCLNLVGKTSLNELASVVSYAQCLIAPDTGTAHIGNAQSTPTIGLYAIAPGWLSRPYNYKHLLIDKFSSAVKQFLHKEPEQMPWKTRVHHRDAMNLIEVDEILQKLEQVLDKNIKS